MLSFQRQGSTSLDPLSYSLVESQSHLARYRLTYPIDEVKSIRTGVVIRLDRAVIQGTEMFSLIAPNRWTDQIGFNISFVHDDTRNPALNIREGLRAKVWAEFYLDGFNASFGTIGFDIRRYFKIYANSIIAFRAAGDWSIGELKLLHLLGGMDNSLSFSNNYGTPIDPSQSYAYQARITPMRGFANNARNGSNATVLNAELRVPVWSTIFKEPAKTDFIRNFQFIGFADIGSAWTGIHPYSEENTFNSTTIENNPITVIIDNNREPIIYDFGYGMRSRVMGYWIAADWGWGIDDGRVLPRKFTLSLNFDF
jgi:outer membrane protein assembly factor BamA